MPHAESAEVLQTIRRSLSRVEGGSYEAQHDAMPHKPEAQAKERAILRLRFRLVWGAANHPGVAMKILPVQFEDREIRRVYDEPTETWLFSVVDIIQVLTQQPDFQAARKYWNKLKERLKKEGSQSVTNCHRLKLPAADGKSYLTDVANAETLLRLVQSVPSPKAGPI